MVIKHMHHISTSAKEVRYSVYLLICPSAALLKKQRAQFSADLVEGHSMGHGRNRNWSESKSRGGFTNNVSFELTLQDRALGHGRGLHSRALVRLVLC